MSLFKRGIVTATLFRAVFGNSMFKLIRGAIHPLPLRSRVAVHGPDTMLVVAVLFLHNVFMHCIFGILYSR